MAMHKQKRWKVCWYNASECVKTEDVIGPETKEEAERTARLRYPDCKWPAPLCSATLIN